MQQKWWLVAAGIVGIGLAVLLFPRPDTGDAPAPDPTNTRPLDFSGDAAPAVDQGKRARKVVSRPVLSQIRRDGPDLSVQRIGPNPIAALNMQNVTPESVHAGRASGPWTVIRRQLLRMEGDADAKVFADEFMPMLEQLRALRTDPEAADYDELEQTQKKYMSALRGHEAWMADEIVTAAVERLETIHNAYHEAVAAQNGEAQE